MVMLRYRMRAARLLSSSLVVAAVIAGGAVPAAATSTIKHLRTEPVLEGNNARVTATYLDAAKQPVTPSSVTYQVTVWQTGELLYEGVPIVPTSNVVPMPLPPLAQRIVDTDLTTTERHRFSSIAIVPGGAIPLSGTYDVQDDANIIVDEDTGLPVFVPPPTP